MPTHVVVMPASFSQRRLWLLDRLEPGGSTYNVPATFQLDGPIDAAALARAFELVQERHEALRTVLREIDGEVYQVVHERPVASLEVDDLRHLPEHEREARARQVAERAATRPFDLARGPLVRMRLARLGEAEHVLCLTMHHAVSDGWSTEVLFRDLTALYAALVDGCDPARADLPVLEIQYADYAAWQRRELRPDTLAAHLDYWKAKLRGAPRTLGLPTDRPRRRDRRTEGARGGARGVTLPDTVVDAVRALARAEGATSFMVLLAAFKALLHRYGGADDVVVGCPVAARPRVETEPLVGFFANTLALRTSLSGDPSFRELVRRVRETATEAYAHQEVPFDRLVAELAPERRLGDTPLIEVMFGLQTVRGGAARRGELPAPGGLRRVAMHTGTAKFDLTLSLVEDDRSVTGSLEYDADLFDAGTAARLVAHFERLLAGAVEGPDARISTLPLLSADERALALDRGRGSTTSYERDACIPAVFASGARRWPDAVAVDCGGSRLTYRELDALANRLARYLQSAGVRRGDRIAVALEPSPTLAVALLAILEAGAAYVPLDRRSPPARLARVLHDTGASLLLADATFGPVAAEHGLQVVHLDGAWAFLEPFSAEPVAHDVGPEDLAYVMYTSGSTGEPKGVCVPHRAVVRLVRGTDYVSLGADDRVAQVSTPAFDASTFEVWGALLNGARLVGIARDVLLSPTDFAAELRRRGVTVLFLTTAIFNRLALDAPDTFATLRVLLTGGERADPRSFREVLRHGPPERLLHVYGPTENTTFTTWYHARRVADDATAVPLGRPIANGRAYVLDRHLEPVPAGVAAELYVGGDGLAAGYWNRPDTTAALFVPDPFSDVPGARLYRTGDQCRLTSEGDIEFLGRLDGQVKMRGFRIELGEIEAVLRRHPAVRDVAVVAREDRPGERRLVAYYVPAAGATVAAAELRAGLRRDLPDYMVPTALVAVERLPVTANGKVDRDTLPAPAGPDVVEEASDDEPRSSAERTLAAIWRELLGAGRVGVRDNFFELGGDSILVIRMIARARSAGLRLTPRQIFQHQTIAELAALDGLAAAAADAEQRAAVGPSPLTPVQCWFFEQGFADPHHFNQGVVVALADPADATVVDEAVRALLRHHDALRSRFEPVGAGWRQVVDDAAPTTAVARVELADVPDAERDDAVRRVADRCHRSLDLTAGPLARFVLLDHGAARPPELLVCIHHLVVDGVSWRVLLEDLDAACGQLRRGEAVRLPAKTAPFGLWAERLRHHARSPGMDRERDYWLSALPFTAPRLPRRDGAPAGAPTTVAAARIVSVGLSHDETRRLLRDLPRAHGTQINDVLLAALVRAFHRWTGSTSLLVDVEGHGREPLFDDVDVSRTVGWFTSIFPVHLVVDAGERPLATLKRVRDQLRGVPDHGIGYGILRYLSDDDATAARLAALPRAEVSFNYQGRFAGAASSSRRSGAPRSERARRSHLIDVNAAVDGEALTVRWTYADDVHARDEIQALAESYADELRAVCRAASAVPRAASEFPLARVPQAWLDALQGDDASRVEDVLALSPLQRGMLFHTLYAPGSGEYVVQTRLRLRGRIDVTRLRRAWHDVVHRHPILRAAFFWEGLDEPVQVVRPEVALPWRRADLRALAPDEQRAHVAGFLEADRRAGFALHEAPLMRFALFELSDTSWELAWTCHHLLLDGWSRPLVVAQVDEAYAALARGGAPVAEPRGSPADLAARLTTYGDYIAWLQRQDAAAAERFWRRHLDGVTSRTRIRVLRPARRGASRAALVSADGTLTEDATAALQAFARSHRVTLNTVVQGAWAILLSRYAAEDDVVFGATVSGRPAELPGVERIVGPFINTVPVRVVVDDDAPLGPWLRRLQDQQAEARQYEYGALYEVQRWSGVPPGEALFDSLVVFENYPIPLGTGSADGERRDDDDDDPAATEAEWTNYPLTVAAVPGKRLKLSITYDAERLEAGAGVRMRDHLLTILRAVAADDGARPVGELEMLTDAERRDGRPERMATAGDAVRTCVHQLVEQQAARTPDAPAVCDGEATLTYGALDARANALARALRAQGVAPGRLVAICLDRSFDLAVAILGVLKAGGAYVPLDPTWPELRLAALLRDAAPTLVLTHAALRAKVGGAGIATLCLDGEWRRTADGQQPRDERAPDADDLAYVIYTSGSTGEPKGVLVPHSALANHSVAMAGHLELDGSDRVLQFASIGFDVAAEELFASWIAGAAVVLRTEEAIRSLRAFTDFVRDARLTVLNLPAPFWHEWLADPEVAVPPSVRRVVVGSDTVSGASIGRWRELTGGRVPVTNAYGPTEATITATIHDATDEDARAEVVPIGRPIRNMRVYVLDARLRPVPVGVPGEIVIGGAGVARGYLNRPEETRARFIPDPFAADGGGRAYRTGDLARRLPNGALEFIGRADRQVKLRGVRVELGEVEAVLRLHPDVGDAVADVRTIADDDATLVAYVAPSHRCAADLRRLDPDALRRFCAERLPAAMLPGALVVLERLPVAATGKVDRRALPDPSPRARRGSRGNAPAARLATREEVALAEIWRTVLRVDDVGADDDFFALGGHSLLAMRLVSRVREAFRTELSVRDVFEHPTLGGLAARLGEAARDRGDPTHTPAAPIARREDAGPAPLSFAQERLWFLEQLTPGTPVYNMPATLRLRGPLDAAAVAASIDEIVRRHESLRTTFGVVDGRPVQIVAPALRLNVPLVDLRGLTPAERAREAQRLGDDDARRPFDLRRGPLLRALLLRLADDEHRVVLTMHHIVSDGWSIGVLLQELEAIYDAFACGKPSPLPELPIQYADYAVWQRRQLTGPRLATGLAYWTRQLAGATPTLDLPTDRLRPAVRTVRGGVESLSLSAELTASLHALSRREGATLFMCLLAAFKIVLSRHAGQDDVSVGSPIAGRERTETEGLIGFFLNNLVLRTDLSGDPTFEELLARVRDVALGGYAHQDVPFERVLEELRPPRDPSRTPLFQVFFNMLNPDDERVALRGVDAEVVSSTAAPPEPSEARELGGPAVRPGEWRPATWSQFDLTLYAGERGGALSFVAVYNADLFDAERIAELLDQLRSLLGQIVRDPGQRIGRYTLVTRRATRVLPDPTAALDASWRGAVHELLAAHARRDGDRTAVATTEGRCTYAEFDRRATQLANHLRAHGVGRGDVVAVYAHRSPTLAWALVGVLRAGAAFTVLDPAYPAARLVAMLETAAPRGFVALDAAGPPAQAVRDLAARCACRVTLPDGLPWDAPNADPGVVVGPDDLACIGFTSGSTGRPKAILGRHGPLTHFVPWLAETFALDRNDRFSMLSGLAHDPLQRDVFTPLCLGASLCVPEPDDILEPGRLARWAAAAGITVAHLTPAMGQLLTQSASIAGVRLETLRLAFYVGDVLTRHDVAALRRWAPHVTCVNYYGTTETQRAVGHFVVPRDVERPAPNAREIIPAGRGIDDVQLLVLNRSGEPAGVGELGEIHVRSPHLARGYLGDDALTAARFLPNPFTAVGGDRLYRTGDLGRYAPDGNVDFAGRADTQVKVRGYRVELGEVEAVIARHPAVREAIVTAREDRPGDRHLAAYVTLRDGGDPTAEVREQLARELPDYMIPTSFTVLPSLPVTPNGKVDRHALPAPATDAPLDARPAPARTPTEHALVAVWRDLLGRDTVGVDDDFFALGGHSLLAAQLMARVWSAFGIEPSLRRFFDVPTIADLARSIDERPNGRGARDAQAIVRIDRAALRTTVADGGALVLPDALLATLRAMVPATDERASARDRAPLTRLTS